MHGRRVLRLAVTLLPWVAWGATAQTTSQQPAFPAHRATLAYRRGVGTEGCPDEPSLRSGVGVRLGRNPFDATGDLAVTASVERGTDRFSARVEVRRQPSGSLVGVQEFASGATDCAALGRALELAVAMAIDPVVASRPQPGTDPSALPGPTAPPPPHLDPEMPDNELLRAQARRPAASFRVQVGAMGTVGAAPDFAWGLTASAGIRWRWASAQLELRADLPASKPLPFETSVRASTAMAAAVVCAHEHYFGVCAMAAGGAFIATGVGLEEARSVVTPYAAAGGRLLLEVPLTRHLSLRGHADVLAPLTRTFLLVDGDEVFATIPISLGMGAGLLASL